MIIMGVDSVDKYLVFYLVMKLLTLGKNLMH